MRSFDKKNVQKLLSVMASRTSISGLNRHFFIDAPNAIQKKLVFKNNGIRMKSVVELYIPVVEHALGYRVLKK